MASLRCPLLVAFLLIGGSVLPGCAEKAKPQENKAADHLRKIATSFDLALHKTGRPPKNAEEIKPFLKLLSEKEEPDDLLRSPNDNEPYEIMWGVNLDRQTELSLILAHEKKGVDGKRYVITVARITMLMSDADFENAAFARAKR